jgi:hypothetical protein
MLVTTVLLTVVTGPYLFEHSNRWLVFLFFFSFGMSILGLCFLLSTFFSRAKTVAILGPIIFLASFFPYYAVNDPEDTAQAKTIGCLLGPVCFGIAADVLADFEGGFVGIQWANRNQRTPLSALSFMDCIHMMLIDAVLYGLLAWYLDVVFPSGNTPKRPLYFPFTPSYWLGRHIDTDLGDNSTSNSEKKASASSLEEPLLASNDIGIDVIDIDAAATAATTTASHGVPSGSAPASVIVPNESAKWIEPPTLEQSHQLRDGRCVKIGSLQKVYAQEDGFGVGTALDLMKRCMRGLRSLVRGAQNEDGNTGLKSGDRVDAPASAALDNVSLNLFENQVTVLLGRNGAGMIIY